MFVDVGVRVPAVIVSPWVKKGTVIHASPDGDSQYEHSSVAATVVHKLFKAKHDKQSPLYLTKRDAWAKTFEWVSGCVSLCRVAIAYANVVIGIRH